MTALQKEEEEEEKEEREMGQAAMVVLGLWTGGSKGLFSRAKAVVAMTGGPRQSLLWQS